MNIKVAVVHDWLVTYAGAERVLEQILKVYPQADLFALCDFLPDDQRGFIGGRKVHTTFIQSLPFARNRYRSYLPLMPLAIEQLDLSGYDLVISSSHAVAKGVLTGPDQIHVSYVHTPIRYAWDMQHQYLRESNLERGLKSWLARWLLHKLRLWDIRTSPGVDHFVSNSKFIARRIKKVYGRTAKVIYPPVDCDRFAMVKEKQNFYLTASRLVPYKRVDLIVEAFNQMPGCRLVVVGDGPDYAKIKAMAGGNVEVLGYQSDERLRELMSNARAFVFAAEEDFGITPVEAQACGTPVIAFGKGGSLETVRTGGDRPTGVFFEEQSAAAVKAAVRSFEAQEHSFSPEGCRAHAEKFSTVRFREEIDLFVQEAMAVRPEALSGSETLGVI
jgi:glycosyltransferase involved in cell wall biosynthesis